MDIGIGSSVQGHSHLLDKYKLYVDLHDEEYVIESLNLV